MVPTSKNLQRLTDTQTADTQEVMYRIFCEITSTNCGTTAGIISNEVKLLQSYAVLDDGGECIIILQVGYALDKFTRRYLY